MSMMKKFRPWVIDLAVDIHRAIHADPGYPRDYDGEVLLIGPAVFWDPEDDVITYQGENYYRRHH